MTQHDLASKIGVTFQQLQKYEAASNRISTARLMDAAEALDMSVGELLPSMAATSASAEISAPDLAKLISLYLRLGPADQQRMLDYAARLDGSA